MSEIRTSFDFINVARGMPDQIGIAGELFERGLQCGFQSTQLVVSHVFNEPPIAVTGLFNPEWGVVLTNHRALPNSFKFMGTEKRPKFLKIVNTSHVGKYKLRLWMGGNSDIDRLPYVLASAEYLAKEPFEFIIQARFRGSDEVIDIDLSPMELENILYTRLDALEFSYRTNGALYKAGYEYVSQILGSTEGELRRIKNLGPKRLNEIKEGILKFTDGKLGGQVGLEFEY